MQMMQAMQMMPQLLASGQAGYVDPNQLAIYQMMMTAYQQAMMLVAGSIQQAATQPGVDGTAGYYNVLNNMDPNMYNYTVLMMNQMLQNPAMLQQVQASAVANSSPGIASVPQRRPEEFTEDPVDECKLFVGGMPKEVTEVILRVYFQQFGPVRSVTIVHNRETGESLGYGFVEFLSRVVGVFAGLDR